MSENSGRKAVNVAVKADAQAARQKFLSIYAEADSAYLKRINDEGE